MRNVVFLGFFLYGILLFALNPVRMTSMSAYLVEIVCAIRNDGPGKNIFSNICSDRFGPNEFSKRSVTDMGYENSV